MSKGNGYPPHLKFDAWAGVVVLAGFVVALVLWLLIGAPGLKALLHWWLGSRYP